MEKVIMIPERRYNVMLKSYDEAIEELQQLKKHIQETADIKESCGNTK